MRPQPLLTIAILAATLPGAVHARDFAPVIREGKVVDRRGRPVAGASVRLVARLDGRTAQGPLTTTIVRRAVTDASGKATLRLKTPFQGAVEFTIEPAGGLRALGFADDTLTVFEPPDRTIDGFPVWEGQGSRHDRVVVLVEGFDLYNRFTATDALRLTGAAGDALRAGGLDLLVVDFPDSHQAPDRLAPHVARAIDAASRLAQGRKVAVVTLSAGGLAARWALCTAENAKTPLPVHTLLIADCPNRGAWFSPHLQAIVLRYGWPEDRNALGSDAARALLRAQIDNMKSQVSWRQVGLPIAPRAVPAVVLPNTEPSRAFFARLRRLNDKNGYPKRCRVVAVANGSRRGAGGGERLLRLWLPGNHFWNQRAEPADRVPGSLLPPLFAARFRSIYPLGIAGSYLRTAPTFLPTESALDAGPDETPPFDAWFALADNACPRAHDDIAPEAGAFVVAQLLQVRWE